MFDTLVGVAAHNLALAAPDRTVAVVSTTEVPTGEMVANKSKHYPRLEQLRNTINDVTRAEYNVFVDAQETAERLLGDHLASNMLLVGAAYQAGALPIPGAAIEEAIRLNGTAVDMNIQAFRWGRLLVADPAKVQAVVPLGQETGLREAQDVSPAALELITRTGATGELHRLLEVRVPELIAYQNLAYAARYADQVRMVHMIERATMGTSLALSLEVAKNLFKLMAFKDEYEVARLLLDGVEQERIKNTFGANAKVHWHLHPTFLRAVGVKNKVKLGGWFRPVLQVLRSSKSVRGTAFDLLGRFRVRRAERALIVHFEDLIRAVCGKLTPANHAAAVHLASLPDMVRGYEDVKMGNVEQYLAAVRRESIALGLDVALPTELNSLFSTDSGVDVEPTPAAR